jgi:hypothetical protein
MADRKIVEKEILYFIDKFLPGSDNIKIYQELFERMDDQAFDAWIDTLDKGEILALHAPNFAEQTLSIERNYGIAKELGYELFQHLILTDPQTGQEVQTANKHLVGLVPIRRQVQMLVKKASVPGSNHVVDERSGQATGDSKGSRFSAPELQVNASKGLNHMVLELMKFRGGDEKAYAAMNRSIVETGEASLDSIMAETPSQVKSNLTMSIYLKAQHLDNNILG